jgi:hypothetical protein
MEFFIFYILIPFGIGVGLGMLGVSLFTLVNKD